MEKEYGDMYGILRKELSEVLDRIFQEERWV